MAFWKHVAFCLSPYRDTFVGGEIRVSLGTKKKKNFPPMFSNAKIY